MLNITNKYFTILSKKNKKKKKIRRFWIEKLFEDINRFRPKYNIDITQARANNAKGGSRMPETSCVKNRAAEGGEKRK